MKVTLNYKNALSFVSEEALNQNKENVLKAYKTLVNKTGEGNDFLGWIEYPKNYDKEEFARIKKAAEKIRSNSEVLVVIGIGGSYLGAKAVIEALKPYFSTKKDLEIVFAGNSLSSTYLNQLLTYTIGMLGILADNIGSKRLSDNIILNSKAFKKNFIEFIIFI